MSFNVHFISNSVRNDIKVIKICHVCTEVNTFITLNISTDTKKGCGPKIPPKQVEGGGGCVLLETLKRSLIKKIGCPLAVSGKVH